MMLTNIFSRIVSLNQAGHGSGEDNSDEIMDILRDSTLEITAELGRTEVKLQDAYFLNIGDVIDLGHPKDEPIYLYWRKAMVWWEAGCAEQLHGSEDWGKLL